jgi:chromosome segregation ATPase
MSTEQLRNHNEQTRLEETATIQELMNQIRSNEMVVAEVHRLRAELEQAKHNQTRADAAEKKNNELTSKSAELERQLVDAKSKLRHAQSQARELSCVTESAELRAKMKESEMESLIEKESKWNQVLCEKDATIKNLRSKYDELEKRHQDDLAALRALESDKFIEGSTIDDLEILREEVVFLENQKRQLEQKIAEKNATLETTRRQNEKDVMDLSSKFVRTQEELRIVRHELSSAHLEMALSHEQTLSLQKQVGDLLAELDSVKKQNRHLQSDSGHHRNETIYLTSKVAAQQEELNEATERADRLQDDNVHLKFLMEKMKEDFNEARVGVAEETGRHIVEITKLKNELVLAREDARKLEEQMESKNISFCKNEESLLGRLNEQKQQIDHLRSLLNQAKEEVSQSRQRATAERVEADSLVTSLRQQVNDLRQQLESADRIRQETQQLLETRSCSYEAVLLDLQQSRDGVKKREKRIDQLSEELEERQVDLQRKDAKLYRYEMELRRLRDETKARTTSTMEKAINRAQELESDKQRLEILVNELREQRNACFDALQEGRRRLMSISQSDRVYGGSELEDILPLPYINDEADRPGLSRSPGYSRRASNDNQIHTPIIELTSSRKKPQERGADPPHIVRAEEIAACVAMNARNTLQQKEEENQHLQAKIYQLEASSKVEQEDLKIRIRRLERELGRR